MTGSNPISARPQHHSAEVTAAAHRSHGFQQAIDNGITTRRATADEIAFRDGYVQGRAQERRIQQHQQRRMQHIYAHQGMVGGLLTGILLTLTVGGIATALAVHGSTEASHTTQTTAVPPLQ